YSQWLYQDPVEYDRPHIPAKTLYLSGAEDGPSFREQSAIVVEQIPNATMHMIEEAGHLPFFEKPDEFYPALIEFIESEPLDMPRSNRRAATKNGCCPDAITGHRASGMHAGWAAATGARAIAAEPYTG